MKKGDAGSKFRGDGRSDPQQGSGTALEQS